MNELSYEYQLDLLRYIARTKEIKVLVQELDGDMFSTTDLRNVFNLIQSYEAKYFVTPKKVSLIEYFKKWLNEQNVQFNPEQVQNVIDTINKCYEDLDSDVPFLNETIVNFAKRQLTRRLLVDYAGKVSELNDEDYTRLMVEMKKISSIGEQTAQTIPGRYLFKDFTTERAAKTDATPFFLKSINRMTAAGGFYSPQLIIFLAAPKGFKTGTILSGAVDFAIMQQKKVLYCDTENGIQALTDRAYQRMVNCTFDELVSGEYDDRLQESSKLCMANGGEIRFEYFPAGVSTLDDVEARMIELADDGFKPEIIVYDYFDKFGVSDKTIREKRLKIQNIYDHAIRLNVKYGTFAISVSQVKQSAVGEAIIDMTDFAEDFGKAANCHAAFAICRTRYELDNGYAHIIPVAQRQGSRYKPGNECFVRIDEDRMLVEELPESEANSLRRLLGISDEEDNTIAVDQPIVDD